MCVCARNFRRFCKKKGSFQVTRKRGTYSNHFFLKKKKVLRRLSKLWKVERENQHSASVSRVCKPPLWLGLTGLARSSSPDRNLNNTSSTHVGGRSSQKPSFTLSLPPCQSFFCLNFCNGYSKKNSVQISFPINCWRLTIFLFFFETRSWAFFFILRFD